MWGANITLAILLFLICNSAQAEDCDQVVKGRTIEAKIEYVGGLVNNFNYDCAIDATRVLASSFAPLPSRDGFDARFKLREFSLMQAKNTEILGNVRVELIESAVISPQYSKPIPKEELIADIRFLLAAIKIFQRQDEELWLDMLRDAIQLNQQLPSGERAIQSWELNGIDRVMQKYVYDSYYAEEWEKLAKIAELTRGDKDLLAFRSQLANWFSYWVPGLYDNKPREEIIGRSREMLRLTELLNDTATGYQCKTGRIGDYGCSMDWQWKPYIRSGLAFHHVGMEGEAKLYIEKGLRVIESEKSLATRLQLYDYAIRDLIRDHYDRATLVDVSAKMQTLADSLGPKFSEEIRSNLANQRYGKW